MGRRSRKVPKRYSPETEIGNGKYEYKGEIYDSYLEVRMAKVLHKNDVPYQLHKMFEVDGNGREREVDFYLETNIKPYWSTHWINAIEVKGWLEPRDRIRRKELQEIGVPTFIATEPVIRYWEKYGFLEFPPSYKNGKSDQGLFDTLFFEPTY